MRNNNYVCVKLDCVMSSSIVFIGRVCGGPSLLQHVCECEPRECGGLYQQGSLSPQAQQCAYCQILVIIYVP